MMGAVPSEFEALNFNPQRGSMLFLGSRPYEDNNCTPAPVREGCGVCDHKL